MSSASCASHRILAWAGCALSLAVAARAHAQAVTAPINYTTPKAAATFLEDHGGWHGGVDFPDSANGVASKVRNPQTGTLYAVFVDSAGTNTSSPQGVLVTINNERSTILGAWQIQVKSARPKFLLDILSVRRVRSGQPPTIYTVSSVTESPAGSGFSAGVVNLVVNSPNAGAALSAATDTLSVNYAFHIGEIRGIWSQTPAGGGLPITYSTCNHIDNIQKFVSWATYPATAANRFYDAFNIPAGRAVHPLVAGQNVAEIMQVPAGSYGTEPSHTHYTLAAGGTAFRAFVNPLNGHLPFNDPNNLRPVVRSFGLVPDSSLAAPPVVPVLRNGRPLYGDMHIFVECGDDMGQVEIGPDRDANNVRETGVYNAGFYLAPLDRTVAPLGTRASPQWFAQPPPPGVVGVDSTQGTNVNTVALLAPNPAAGSGLFKVDNNTNYHVWVSHVGYNPARLWRTDADVLSGANPDGSTGARALQNLNALFPDGAYKLGGVAKDLVGQGAFRDTLLTVDNFRPFVHSVLVKQNGLIAYQGTWNDTASNNKLDLAPPLLKDRQNRFIFANLNFEVKVICSESVAFDSTFSFAGSQTLTLGPKTYQVRFDAATALKYDPQGDGAVKGADAIAITIDSLATTYHKLDTIWATAIISDATGLGLPTYDGDATLIVDLEDLSTTGTGAASGGSGNRLLAMDFVDYVAGTNQIDCATKLTRAANGSLRGTPGLDKVHKFKIDTRPPVIEITPQVTP